jgi:uncharacterized protein (DUF58 family)
LLASARWGRVLINTLGAMKRFTSWSRAAVLPALVAAAFSLGGVGCSGSTPPRIRAEGVAVRERTPEGVVLEITLEADNLTGTSIPLREVTYSLFLDGEKVFEGQRSAEATVQRFGTQRIVLPAAFPPRFAAEGPVRYRVEGELTYLARGVLAEALFDADVIRPSVSFSDEGEAVLRDQEK